MPRTFLALLLASAAAPAFAQSALPEPVRAMVVAAAETGDAAKIDAVVAVAKQTNPESAAEIDAIVKSAADARAAKRTSDLQSASFFDFWEGRLNIGGAVATGNEDSFNLAVGLGLTREGIRWRHALSGAIDIQKANGVTSQERITAGWQSNYKLSERVSLFGAFGYEKNFSAGIDNRFIESFGLGWRAAAPRRGAAGDRLRRRLARLAQIGQCALRRRRRRARALAARRRRQGAAAQRLDVVGAQPRQAQALQIGAAEVLLRHAHQAARAPGVAVVVDAVGGDRVAGVDDDVVDHPRAAPAVPARGRC